MASEDISLKDLMPGFPIPGEPDPDVVAVPESVDEQELLRGDDDGGMEYDDVPLMQPGAEEAEESTALQPTEILPPMPSTSSLSAKELAAAQADAAGVPRSRIAAMIGVTPARISQFRQRPEYQAEVERVKSGATSDLELPMQAMYTNLIVGTNEAIETLKLALNAMNDDGRPAWTTRLRAAEKLLEMGLDFSKTKTATGNEAGGGLQMNASGAVVLVLKDG